MVDKHDCIFPEVVVGVDDPPLKPGMKVLTPCPECGDEPYDHLEWTRAEQERLQQALVKDDPEMSLYHWAPHPRRKQIKRYGLRPGMKLTTSSGVGMESFVAPVCFAVTPSWAWALTLKGRGYGGLWDLWETRLDWLKDPIILPDEDPDHNLKVYEVRTEHRVYKRHLWLVGSRDNSGVSR